MSAPYSLPGNLFRAMCSTQVRAGQKLTMLDPERLQDPPVAYLLAAREERYERAQDGSVARATIHIGYDVIFPHNIFDQTRMHEFEGSFSDGSPPCVSLTSFRPGQGAVFLDLPNLASHRIGTYLMNEIVCWVRQWPDAEVYPIQLLTGQAHGDNKERRNRFYTQFGIVFDFDDASHRTGRSRETKVSELTPVDTWRANIREISIEDALREALSIAQTSSADLEHSRRQYNSLNDWFWKQHRRHNLLLRVLAATAAAAVAAAVIGTWAYLTLMH